MIGLFAKFSDGSVYLHEEEPVEILDHFPPSCIEFKIYSDNTVKAVSTDLTTPGELVEEIKNKLDTIIDKEEEFRKIKGNFCYGLFIKGPSGSGKTTQLRAAAKYLVSQYRSIVFLPRNPEDLYAAIDIAKRIENPDQLFTFIIDGYSTEYTEELKDILDGHEDLHRAFVIISGEDDEDISPALLNVQTRIINTVQLNSNITYGHELRALSGETSFRGKKIGFKNG